MSEITRPRKLLDLGISLLVIGGLLLVCRYSDSDSRICTQAPSYKLTPTHQETEIELSPDCWSGEITADYKIFWSMIGSQNPYEARFVDSYIYKGNSPDSMINEKVKHRHPVRFRGTGKIKISIVQFENSISTF